MTGNVHDKSVTEAQVAILKAMTPHIVAMSLDERQRAIIGNANLPTASGAWLNNGCRLMVKGPSTLIVDRTKPFDPVKLVGRDWEIGEQDERALALTEIDFSCVRFDSGHLKGEDIITGEVKFERLKQMPDIRLDAKTAQALYEEEGQITLRWIHKTFRIVWMEFATVLRNSNGDRCVLCLNRDDDGSWDWGCSGLDSDRVHDEVSPLLASSPMALFA